jgi:hypothetical protein
MGKSVIESNRSKTFTARLGKSLYPQDREGHAKGAKNRKSRSRY